MMTPPMHEPQKTKEALALLSRIGWRAEMTLGELITAAGMISLDQRRKVGRVVNILMQGPALTSTKRGRSWLAARHEGNPSPPGVRGVGTPAEETGQWRSESIRVAATTSRSGASGLLHFEIGRA